MMTYPDRIRPEALGWLAYRKPGKGLLLLRDAIVGPERLDAAFRDLHPPLGLQAPAACRLLPDRRGRRGRGPRLVLARVVLRSRTSTTPPSQASASTATWPSATVENRLPLVFPATVEFRFSDGTTERAVVPVEAFVNGPGTARVMLNGRTPVAARLDPTACCPTTTAPTTTCPSDAAATAPRRAHSAGADPAVTLSPNGDCSPTLDPMTRPLPLLVALLVAAPAFAQGAPARLAATNDSIFAPLPLPTPNVYRAADGRPGPELLAEPQRLPHRGAPRHRRRTRSPARSSSTYTNNSPEALHAILWFHLEQNLFAPGARGATGAGTRAVVDHRARPGLPHRHRHGRRPARHARRHGHPDARSTCRSPSRANGGTVTVDDPVRLPRPGRPDAAHGAHGGRAGDGLRARAVVPARRRLRRRLGLEHDAVPRLGRVLPRLRRLRVQRDGPGVDARSSARATLQNPDEVYTAAQRARIARARASRRRRVRIVEPARGRHGHSDAEPDGHEDVDASRAENVRDVAWAASAAFIVDGADAAHPAGRRRRAPRVHPERRTLPRASPPTPPSRAGRRRRATAARRS